MVLLNLYKVLSFILLPIGCYIALGSISAILFAIGNPALLLFLFVLTCVPIYIFTSFMFVFNGLIKSKPCKSTLKDWIKINGFISILFSAILILVFVVLINHPEVHIQLISQINTMQKSIQSSSPTITANQLLESAYAGIAFGIVLLVHIYLSYTFIKAKGNLFE
jgi:hypothetical protein